ncbi:hypothetical protein GGR52DRAFT_554382 [Hypoxylon sp. FL1284]|nr:hypothetical protein GGR52DRAFT_554382 [Hypoxylon sp. FL1284]
MAADQTWSSYSVSMWSFGSTEHPGAFPRVSPFSTSSASHSPGRPRPPSSSQAAPVPSTRFTLHRIPHGQYTTCRSGQSKSAQGPGERAARALSSMGWDRLRGRLNRASSDDILIWEKELAGIVDLPASLYIVRPSPSAAPNMEQTCTYLERASSQARYARAPNDRVISKQDDRCSNCFLFDFTHFCRALVLKYLSLVGKVPASEEN